MTPLPRLANDVPGPARSYQSMMASAAEAIGRIRPGQRVFLGTGCGQPQALIRALLDHADECEDVEIDLMGQICAHTPEAAR